MKNSPRIPGAVLVTSATSGIAPHLVREFARAGQELVLVGPIPEELETAAVRLRAEHGVVVHTVEHDLRAERAPADVFSALMSRGVHVGIVINNATQIRGHAGDDAPREDAAQLLANLEASMRVARQFVPAMCDRRAGRILITASFSGAAPEEQAALYRVTKNLILASAEDLAAELDGAPITLTALCPGPLDASVSAEAGVERAVTPQELAHVAYEALMRGERVVSIDSVPRIETLVERSAAASERADNELPLPSPAALGAAAA